MIVRAGDVIVVRALLGDDKHTKETYTVIGESKQFGSQYIEAYNIVTGNRKVIPVFLFSIEKIFDAHTKV